MSYTLYSYYRSSASFRVRIALHLKQLSFEYRPIHLLEDGGQQHKEEYRKLNPMGEVPCLIVDGVALGQSMAILQYLDATHPQPPFFPKDPMARARVIQACEIINSGIQPLQNLKVTQELEKMFGIDHDGQKKWIFTWVTRGFTGLERLISTTSGQFAFGDEVSAADIYIVPQVFAARRFQVDLSAYPNILRSNENCMKLEAFQKAFPDQQPDFPPA